MTPFAAVVTDPAWPWSLPAFGLTALAATALVIAALTVWTYLDARAATPRRVALLLLLRLLALLVAFVVVLRPSFAFEEEDTITPSKLFIFIDASESMKITDEFNNLSRWDNARRILKSPAVADTLRKLAAEKVEIVYYQAAENLQPYQADGQAAGKATDMGGWLDEFLKRHGREPNLRGLVLLGDGLDNGTRFPTLDKAAQLRGVCALYPFGLGKPTTTTKQNDIVVADIRVDPDPIPVKGKMTVKALVNAPGFENARVTVSLFVQEPGAKEPRLALRQDGVTLDKTTGNELALTCDAPEAPGEIKVTLKLQPLEGEVSTLNNEIATYASVTKEGVSILWVEGRKRFESVFAIRYALGGDQRFRVVYAEKPPEAQPRAEGDDWFQFGKRHYDVVVIGDISAQRFAGGKKEVFRQVSDHVHRGGGLLLMGGHEAFGASDWNTPLAADVAALLPVELNEAGAVEQKVRMLPTKAGEEYLLKLDPNPKKNDELWKRLLDPLDGLSRLGAKKPTGTLFAQGPDGEPILVGGKVGNEGRVLVFAGDTTWKAWRRNPEALAAHRTFWKQMMLYLARQENMDSSVQLALAQRRLPAEPGQRLAFTVKAVGKSGQAVDNPQFTVKVTSPKGEVRDVPVALEGGEHRGLYFMPDAPGEYKVEATAKDAKGAELSPTPASARFLGYAQDREMLRTAADHDFLSKLAELSGGRFALADERQLANLLEEVAVQKKSGPRPRSEQWHDWRRLPASDALGDQATALWHSTALPCFVLFTGLLCAEWFLRRRWGLV